MPLERERDTMRDTHTDTRPDMKYLQYTVFSNIRIPYTGRSRTVRGAPKISDSVFVSRY